MQQRQEERLALLLNDDGRRAPWRTHNVLYTNLRNRISHVALKEIMKNEDEARSAINNPRDRDFSCSGLYRSQHGLPCWHDLYDLIRERGENASLPLNIVSMHWHLTKAPLPDDREALLRIQDPRIIPRRQGGRAGDEHRRDRHHDELLAPRGGTRGPPPPQGGAPGGAPPPQWGAQQVPRQRAPPRCTGCGGLGHNFSRCPLNQERR